MEPEVTVTEDQAREYAAIFTARAERHPEADFREVLRKRADTMERVANYLRLEVAAVSVNFGEEAGIYWPLRCLQEEV